MHIPSRKDAKGEQARRKFERFVREVEPEFDLQWFHRELCDEIQEWATTDDPYILILQMPPGHAKSTYAKLACAWTHGRDPDARLVYTSYGQTLANEHCGDIQDILFKDEYKDLFPGVRINERSVVSDVKGRGARRTVDMHEIIGHDGRLVAVGTGGPITGGRYDVAVIDDPLKGPKEAGSFGIRDDQWRWLTRTVMTRKRPGRPMRIMLLLTRWNLDDLAGRIQEHMPDQCRVVSFPALKLSDDDDRDPREIGEALWPAVATKEELEEKKKLDPAGFASLYQQNPVPEGGTIVKLDDVQYWSSLPSMQGRWVQSWDLRAGGKSPTSSYAVGQLWFVPTSQPANAYLVDQKRGRWDINETLTQIQACANDPIWKRATTKLVEDKADGRAVIPMLQSKVTGIEAVRPVGDKESRLQAVAPLFRGANVFLPCEEIAPWIRDYVHELTTFPGSANDDQVDATTQALSYLLIPDVEDDEGGCWGIW